MDIRELDRRAVESTGRIIDALTDEQLDVPTPCTEWAVREVIAHMVDNHVNFLRKLAGEAPALSGDPRVDFRETAAALAALADNDEVLAAPYEMPIGTVNGRIALSIHFNDTLVHGWDIGTAVGVDVRLDEDLVEAALGFISTWPDTPEVWGPGKAFSARLPVADDASPQERLLALTGRSPAWSTV
ncbi:TIGR03086 family metal-binding protein [Actinokineospora iranica]|uniref:TIGR03086 family protein n=1 Tax=Actinokineospora iranica TaxID=1271860 RepID=A0A1G6TQ87_9PSEU|nr:TIGR03086 family metal-binding protein [Actinokineospora iranica]SDD31268.1 TIGR03086 family protein [Actinokineospora iranica]